MNQLKDLDEGEFVGAVGRNLGHPIQDGLAGDENWHVLLDRDQVNDLIVPEVESSEQEGSLFGVYENYLILAHICEFQPTHQIDLIAGVFFTICGSGDGRQGCGGVLWVESVDQGSDLIFLSSNGDLLFMEFEE